MQEWCLQLFIVLQTFILQLYPGKYRFIHKVTATLLQPPRFEIPNQTPEAWVSRKNISALPAAVMDGVGIKRSSCCFNVQSITSKPALLSPPGLGLLRFLSIRLHQVETYQPFTWCTVHLRHVFDLLIYEIREVHVYILIYILEAIWIFFLQAFKLCDIVACYLAPRLINDV